jgi:hypothetical protein
LIFEGDNGSNDFIDKNLIYFRFGINDFANNLYG